MTTHRDPAPLDPQLLERARRWALEEPDARHAATLTAELEAAEGGDADAAEAVRSRFAGPLAFGTAGLRAEEGPGESRMNRLVVRRAAAGIARYLADTLGEDEAAASVVIGYDARHGSAAFARDSAGVFTAAGAQVTLLPRPLPTPVLAFLVRHLGADAGVMVTASHNPPADNGYKVYLGGRVTDAAGRGAQIVSPADAEISVRIDHDAWFADIPMVNSGWEVADEELVEAYSVAALGVLDEDRRESTGRDALSVVYTPLHGVGGAVLPGLLGRAGFTGVHVVTRQAEPDADFPTVTFPNPEEPGALDLAFAAAAERDADLVIANDPDADRLALAAPDQDGTWRMLSGDQVGSLLGAHLMPRLEAMGRSTACSIVSSPQLSRLAAEAGVDHYATLTGFKWISRAPEIGYGYEEALGYCVAPDLVRDKDGMTAALMAADLAAGLKAEGRTVWDALADLDATTGAMPSAQVSMRVEDLQIIVDAMARLRAEGIAELAGDPVTTSVDLAAGSEDLPPTDGLLFATDTGTRVVIRPSGTEPKLKCYLGTADADPQAAHARLDAVREQIAALVAG